MEGPQRQDLGLVHFRGRKRWRQEGREEGGKEKGSGEGDGDSFSILGLLFFPFVEAVIVCHDYSTQEDSCLII